MPVSRSVSVPLLLSAVGRPQRAGVLYPYGNNILFYPPGALGMSVSFRRRRTVYLFPTFDLDPGHFALVPVDIPSPRPS